MPRGHHNPHSELVHKFIAENPDLPSRTCSRILFKAHPGLWKDEDQVRQIIRYQRNAMGEKAGRNGSGNQTRTD